MKKLLLTLIFLLPLSLYAETSILFLGDSLTAGHGVDEAQGYVALVEKKLAKKGYKLKISNGSVSGSTSASAAGRMRWFLKAKPDWVFLALGANDGLRGRPVSEIAKDLNTAIDLAQKAGVKVMLAGMRMPPNYGEVYTRDFAAMYRQIAAKKKLALLPFVLKGVGGRPWLNQSDGIHPNPKGHAIIADLVADFIEQTIK